MHILRKIHYQSSAPDTSAQRDSYAIEMEGGVVELWHHTRSSGYSIAGIDVHYRHEPADTEPYAHPRYCHWTGGECWTDGTFLDDYDIAKEFHGFGVDKLFGSDFEAEANRMTLMTEWAESRFLDRTPEPKDTPAGERIVVFQIPLTDQWTAGHITADGTWEQLFTGSRLSVKSIASIASEDLHCSVINIQEDW